jgi:uncharacterized protein (DUF1015 family)
MVRVAGFRGALLNPSRVDVASVASAPVTGVKTKLANGELLRDTHASVYRYHQTFAQAGRTVTRKTVIAAVKLEPWSAGVIRPHEETSPMARGLATAGIAHEAAHTEALFCGYRDSAREVDRLLAPIENQQPAIRMATADDTIHTLWRESDPDVIAALQSALATTPLHVLDGHGRYEGMLANRESLGGDKLPAKSSGNYGLACLVNIEDPTLEVVPRHRVVREAGSRRDVLTAAKPFFAFERIPRAADDCMKQLTALAELGDQLGFLVLFHNDPDAWRLALLPTTPLEAPHKIDQIVFEDLFLDRVIPGTKARSVIEPATVMKAVEDGAIGVMMRPVRLENVLRADETGKPLPFGSTAFRPVLARLVTYVIDLRDELA